MDDATPLAHIQAVIAESPFHGQGHRKIWARLHALKQVRTSMRRVLRLIREADLLSPARHPAPVVAHPHDGTIVTDQPNCDLGHRRHRGRDPHRGIGHDLRGHRPLHGRVRGILVAKRGDRFEALEPIRQGVRDHFRGLGPASATGLALRHDHGSVYLSADFQAEITFLGMSSSPAFVRQPQGNGGIERFFRTLKEQLLWVRHFTTFEELRQALLAFKETYNREWLIERLGYRPPTQVQQVFAVRLAA